MNFGLESDDYKFIQETLKPLTESGAKIYCFGSRARGDHKKFSDLDLMVEGSGSYDNELGLIKESFEESRLPIKVDIVELKNFAVEYLQNYEKDKVKF